MLLEKEHDNYNSENELRKQCEKLLEETKQLHDKTSQEVNHQRKQGLDSGYSRKLHSHLLMGARFNYLPPTWIFRVCDPPPANILDSIPTIGECGFFYSLVYSVHSYRPVQCEQIFKYHK